MPDRLRSLLSPGLLIRVRDIPIERGQRRPLPQTAPAGVFYATNSRVQNL